MYDEQLGLGRRFICFAGVVGICISVWYLGHEIVRSVKWPSYLTTTAHVQSCVGYKATKKDKATQWVKDVSYNLKCKYDYEINGVRYEREEKYYGHLPKGFKIPMAGNDSVVRYNPNDPRESTLFPFESGISAALSVLLLFVGVTFMASPKKIRGF